MEGRRRVAALLINFSDIPKEAYHCEPGPVSFSCRFQRFRAGSRFSRKTGIGEKKPAVTPYLALRPSAQSRRGPGEEARKAALAGICSPSVFRDGLWPQLIPKAR
jgi:hypothetical protein